MKQSPQAANYLQFNGSNGGVDGGNVEIPSVWTGSPKIIDRWGTGYDGKDEITIECYFRARTGELAGCIWNKNRMRLYALSNGTLRAENLRSQTPDVSVLSISSTTYSKDVWHHLAACLDDAGDRKFHIFLDGEEVSYSTQRAQSGTVSDDEDWEIYVGGESGPGLGIGYAQLDIAWLRLSGKVRYTTSFTPPPRCQLPAIDSDTKGQWIGTESSPLCRDESCVDNQEGTEVHDGEPWGDPTDSDAPDYGIECGVVGTYLVGAVRLG